MPSIITHSLVGVAAGRELIRWRQPLRFWILTVVCPVLPDLDVVSFSFGIAYGNFFGHRGFFHSPFFALLVSILVVRIFFKNRKFFSKQWWILVGFFFLITASHGILDAFTNGGLGIALLAPFDNTRYFAPWTPVQVSPIGFGGHWQWRLSVLISEAIWIWLPLGLLLIALRAIHTRIKRHV